MALGYEGWASITHNTGSSPKTNVECLATGTSGIYGSSRLESSSGYGGQIDVFSTIASEVGVASPRSYDYPVFDGSFDFEVNETMADLIWENMIQQRQNRWELLYQTRKGTLLNFDHNYWNSITLQAGDGTFVTGSISWVGLNYISTRGDGAGDSYCGNQFGFDGPQFDWQNTNPLNKCNYNLNPIPFWDSNPLINGVNIDECLDWSLSFNQDVVKFFTCENSSAVSDPLSDAPPPSFVACGPMKITFDFTEMIGLSSTGNAVRGDILASAGAVGLSVGTLELNSMSDNVESLEAAVPVTYSYDAYFINA